MKTTLRKSLPRLQAFTLVELLIVIAIIAILAAMLLPVISVAEQHAKKTQAKIECNTIGSAIQAYESDYSRMPVSGGVQSSGFTNFTYGSTFNTTTTPQQIGSITNGGSGIITNSEVIAILLDLTNYVNNWNNNGITDNANHQKNPRRTIYLPNTHSSGWDPSQGGQPQPGIGNDLVYRDPWGNPYVITMDLNEDNNAVDAFYSQPAVSSSTGVASGLGYYDLTWHPEIGNGVYAFHGNVMVWSAGPDGKVDPNPTPPGNNSSFNKDNVTSWQ
jgi:prepilin-type N-terminal cleavage/methylation domain-containing protein